MKFDDVLGAAKGALDVASKKTNEVVNISKLKIEVLNLSTELDKLYKSLGKTIYSMRKDNYENDDLIDSLCESIEEIKAKIDAINKKIADEKSTIICPTCNTSNSNSNMYCTKCGTKIQEEFTSYKAEVIED